MIQSLSINCYTIKYDYYQPVLFFLWQLLLIDPKFSYWLLHGLNIIIIHQFLFFLIIIIGWSKIELLIVAQFKYHYYQLVLIQWLLLVDPKFSYWLLHNSNIVIIIIHQFLFFLTIIIGWSKIELLIIAQFRYHYYQPVLIQ